MCFILQAIDYINNQKFQLQIKLDHMSNENMNFNLILNLEDGQMYLLKEFETPSQPIQFKIYIDKVIIRR